MKKLIYSIFYMAIVLSVYLSTVSNSGGIKGASTVGCGGGGCHAGQKSVNTKIELKNGSNFTSYSTGVRYNLTVEVSNSDYSANSLAESGINVKVSDGEIVLVGNNLTKEKYETYHSAPKKLDNGSVEWYFEWEAPSACTGDVSIDIAANVVDGDNSNSGDAWNFKKFIIEEQGLNDPCVNDVESNNSTSSSTSIMATIHSNNVDVEKITIEYGESMNYGQSVDATPFSISKNMTENITAQIENVKSNTLYNYRVKVESINEVFYSSNNTFKTLEESTSAVSDLKEYGINVYPSLVEDVFTIKLNNTIKIQEIKLISIDGKSQSMSFYQNGDKAIVNTLNFSSGKYYVEVSTGGDVRKISNPIIIK